MISMRAFPRARGGREECLERRTRSRQSNPTHASRAVLLCMIYIYSAEDCVVIPDLGETCAARATGIDHPLGCVAPRFGTPLGAIIGFGPFH